MPPPGPADADLDSLTHLDDLYQQLPAGTAYATPDGSIRQHSGAGWWQDPVITPVLPSQPTEYLKPLDPGHVRKAQLDAAQVERIKRMIGSGYDAQQWDVVDESDLPPNLRAALAKWRSAEPGTAAPPDEVRALGGGQAMMNRQARRKALQYWLAMAQDIADSPQQFAQMSEEERGWYRAPPTTLFGAGPEAAEWKAKAREALARRVPGYVQKEVGTAGGIYRNDLLYEAARKFHGGTVELPAKATALAGAVEDWAAQKVGVKEGLLRKLGITQGRRITCGWRRRSSPSRRPASAPRCRRRWRRGWATWGR